MAIEDGSLASADDVMNAIGRTLKIYSNLVWNTDLNGFNSNLQIDLENYEYDTLQDGTKIDQTNSEIKDGPVFGANVMDDFEDSSINTNIWATSGTVIESSGRMRLGEVTNNSEATAISTASQVNAEDFNRTGTIFSKTTYTGVTSSGGSGDVSVILVDESANSVTLFSNSWGGNQSFSTDQKLRIEIDPATNTAYVNTGNYNVQGSSKDLTGLQDGDEWHLKFLAHGDGGGGEQSTTFYNIFFVRFLSNAIVQKDFISETVTTSETITNAILVVSKDVTNGSIDYFMSADNGVNYKAVVPNEICRFSNTGTQLKVKAELNSTVDKVAILNHYAVQYNWY